MHPLSLQPAAIFGTFQRSAQLERSVDAWARRPQQTCACANQRIAATAILAPDFYAAVDSRRCASCVDGAAD